VNSSIYGGSGDRSACSRSRRSDWIALHEMGHTAFGLADEYAYYAGGAEPDASIIRREAREPNVTINTDRGRQVELPSASRHRCRPHQSELCHGRRSAKPRRGGHRRPLRARATSIATRMTGAQLQMQTLGHHSAVFAGAIATRIAPRVTSSLPIGFIDTHSRGRRRRRGRVHGLGRRRQR
jgi:hypothetical protein